MLSFGIINKRKTIKSTNIINDPYDNYNELELDVAESGRTMEYYIIKDINKIKFLKFSFSPKKDLYNHTLWTDENFENLNLMIENLMKNDISNEYLNYEFGHFPMKKDKDNEDKESDNEIDWEYSSPGISEGEVYFKNKPDIKNKNFDKYEEFEYHSNIEDIKPIVKY